MLSINTSHTVPLGNTVRGRGTSAGGAAVAVTIPGKTGYKLIICAVQWSYSATPTGGKLTIASESVAIEWEIDVAVANPGGYQLLIEIPSGEDATITLAAPGGAVVGKVNVQGAYIFG
jgi:hypothetical protein